MSPARQSGVALLTALVIAFAAVAMATRLAAMQQVDIHRTEGMLLTNRLEMALADVERQAFAAIARDRQERVTGYRDPRKLDLPGVLPGSAEPAMEVQATLNDAHRRFNVNDLDPRLPLANIALARFRRLLDGLGLDPDLASAVADWIDEDSTRRPRGGAEDDVYTRQRPPFRTANRPLERISELRRIKGITDTVYRQLAPHVVALPPNAGVNVNVASREVLRSLDEKIDQDTVDEIVRRRETLPFDSVDAFVDLLALEEIPMPVQGLSVVSQYFWLRTEIVLDERGRNEVALLRDGEGERRVVARYPEER